MEAADGNSGMKKGPCHRMARESMQRAMMPLQGLFANKLYNDNGAVMSHGFPDGLWQERQKRTYLYLPLSILRNTVAPRYKERQGFRVFRFLSRGLEEIPSSYYILVHGLTYIFVSLLWGGLPFRVGVAIA